MKHSSFRKCPQHDVAPLHFYEGFVRNLLIENHEKHYNIATYSSHYEQIPHKAACINDYCAKPNGGICGMNCVSIKADFDFNCIETLFIAGCIRNKG